MTTAIKRRRGTTEQHATFTGLEGEITVDTTKDTLVVHDGATAGGFPLAKESTVTALDSATVHKTGDETIAGTKTLSSNPILSAGTANGVAYLNGSKVLTTGSALTFDGTNLGVGTSSPLGEVGYSILQLNSGSPSRGGILKLSYADNVAAQLYNNGIHAGISTIQSGSTFTLNSVSSSIFKIADTEQMRLTSTGLGIGVTPSAWYSTYKSFEIGNTGSIALDNNFGRINVGNNYYVNTSGQFTYKYTGLASYYSQYAGYHYWFTAPSGTAGNAISFTQAMTLDASGNLGVGTTNTSSGRVSVGVANSVTPQVAANFTNNVNADCQIQIATNYSSIGPSTNTPFAFVNGGGERMRIDSIGNLLVGGTVDSAGGVVQKMVIYYPGGGTRYGLGFRPAADSTQAITFANAANSQVGCITTSATATAYITSSDYRLKENIQPMQNALGVVQQLNPVTYTWKSDGSDGQGFIAHELQAVVPDCVTGEKDAVDEEGNPVYQGIDTSFLVATLTKAIQELKAELDSLKAQLENK